MMRSLYSAVSGLQGHQLKMDVIGNNIANVNTVGFKEGRVSFEDLLSQTLQGPSAPSAAQGGTDPIQVGLGVNVGSLQNLMTQGSAETTGKNTDMMIQGDGFFVLNDNGTQVYTRAGSFDTDGNGNLVDPNTGAMVQGYSYNAAQTEGTTLGSIQLVKGTPFPGTVSGGPGYVGTLSSFSIDNTGTITGVYVDPTTNVSTTMKIAQIALAGFNNPGGLVKQGDNYYTVSNDSGAAQIGTPGTGGRGSVATGELEMSNVDLSQEFTDMITAQRGFQANARVITVSDTLLQELVDLKRS